MTRLSTAIEQRLSGLPEFVDALKHAVEHGLVDLDPWILITSDRQVDARTVAISGRYPGREVLCFSQRQDTDDVACVVLSSSAEYAAGQVLIVHDFAKAGSEVDAVFSDFWEWFKAAIDDMIETFRHWGEPR
ncbi:MAG: hypothetical protein QOE51_4347 [Actinoplanes sp.]|nr:hypothetical protein [Actinoplanes sp.]